MCVYTIAVPPLAPTGVIVSSITTRTARVTWDHSVVSFLNNLTKVAGYRIVARQNAFNISDVVVNVPLNQTVYVFRSTLEEFTVYSCEVYARNSFGYGVPSEAVQFKTLQDGK